MATNDSGEAGKDSKSTQSSRSLRGKVCLNKLAQRKSNGIRLVIEFDDLGQPCGPNVAEMQSYIGLLARQEVKISYKSWKTVPRGVKDTLWDHVTRAYDVNENWKSDCFKSANTKWRQWKCSMYQDHIVPNKDNVSKLNRPPPSSGILQEDWSKFVRSRTTDEFKKLSAEQTERIKKNKYPHRLSRRGYVGLAASMKDELCGDDDIDRAMMWKKARLTKKNDIEDESLKMAVKRIDDYIQKKKEGGFKTARWGEDLLTCALEKKEHAGRVKAIGSYVTPTLYFKHSREKRRDIKEELFKDLLEAKKLISEQNQMICELQERVSKVEADRAKDKEIEGNESCSVKQPYYVMEVEDDDGQNIEDMVIIDKVDALQEMEFTSSKVKVKLQGVKERKIKSYKSLHPSMKALYLHFEKSLKDGEGIFIHFDDDMFGTPLKSYIHMEDIIPFCDLEPISGNCIVVYTQYLYTKLKENDALDHVLFVNPFEISHMAKKSEEIRSTTLGDRLRNMTSNQTVVVPVNVGEHWILTVIIHDKETVTATILDPLGHQMHRTTWMNVVNRAISKNYLKILGKRKKKPITWEVLKAPGQPDVKQCGFFVMRYMKEIIEKIITSGSISLQSCFDKREYSQEDIDVVRVEWADYFFAEHI